METKQKAKPGPKPVVHTEDVVAFFIRDMPLSLRNRAKSKAAALGISLKEFTIRALTKKVDSTP